MKSQVKKFVISAAGALRSKGAAAAFGLAIVSLGCAAQSAQQIAVQGKDSSWKLVGTVDPMTGFQIGAKGSVNFGGLGHKDDPNAGVTGNPFAKIAENVFGLGIEYFVKWLEGASVDDGSSGGTNSDGGANTTGDDFSESFGTGNSSSAMHWNWVDYINTNGSTVNYDEGAFFVSLTTTSQAPSQGNAANQVASPALFYWYKKIFENGGDIAYDQKVWVWVKIHDGGRSPYSTSSFGDNSGSYSIWIDPDQQISDTALKASVPLPTFRNTAAAQQLKARFVATTAGKRYHVVTILQRKTPNHQPG
jgi:hypothetical protein